MTQLIKYEAARTALAEANSIDEVKGIRDKAEAMRAYARQSKDFQMANWAAEIRIRAERKLGQMLKGMEKNKGVKLDGKDIQGNYRQSQAATTEAPKLSDLKITKSESSRAQIIASVPEKEFESTIVDHREKQKELTSNTIRQLYDKAPVTRFTGQDEWYTPMKYIDSARRVMGSIDLDPASNSEANKVVNAKTYYSREDDGLTKPWRGNVWLNPPYGATEIKAFTAKLIEESGSGRLTQAIMLTSNNTDTAWFHDLANAANLFCFPKGRINFYRGTDKEKKEFSSPTNGQCFFYFGINGFSFWREFLKYGLVMTGK